MTDPLSDLQSRLALMQKHKAEITKMTPFARELGFEITEIEQGHVWGIQPWAEKLVGDPESGIIHGGVITAFLDNLCGMSCGTTLAEFRAVATLDLRIDYMRPADKGRDIIGEAECYSVTRTVAFCRAWAYHDSRDKVIATASGAFAIGKTRNPLSGSMTAPKKDAGTS